MRDEGRTKGVNLYSPKDFHFFLTLLFFSTSVRMHSSGRGVLFILSNVSPSSCNNSAASPPPIRLGVLADNEQHLQKENQSNPRGGGGMTVANGPTA